MTLVVKLPLGDPTLTPDLAPGERLLDLGGRFVARVADPQALRDRAAGLDRAEVAAQEAARAVRRPALSLPDPGAAPEPLHPADLPLAQRCLLALAAADALAEPADPVTLMRAVGAAIRVVSADDAGLTASLDDVVLRTGSTQSSRDSVGAATRCTLFDPELSAPELSGADAPAAAVPTAAAGAAVGGGGSPARVVPGQRVFREPDGDEELDLVVDTDQQLPVALRLVARLAGTRRVTLSGRFVARHREALARVPELAGVRLEGRTRTRRVVTAPDAATDRAPVWVTAREELPADGRWAGWLDADDVVRLAGAVWDRCTGLVVSAPGPTSGTFPGARGPGLAVLLPRLAARFPVALEVVVGAPLSAPVRLDAPWWAEWGGGLRLAGFRPYRRPLRSGETDDGRYDLARWAGEPSSGPLEAAVLARAAERYDLFPGRLAAAVLLAEQHPPILDGYAWDPAVRPVRLEHLSVDGRGPGEFLVSLRSGRLSRVQPSLGRLVTALRSRGPESLAENALPPGRREELLTGLCRTGLLRRVTAA